MGKQGERPSARQAASPNESALSGPGEPHYHLRFTLDSFLNVCRSTPSGRTILSGMVIEISAVGMSAILPEDLEIGERVTLTVQLILETLTIDGIVQYSHKFRHGFRFVDVNAEQQRQIQEACARLRVYCRDKGDCIEWRELHRHGATAHGSHPADFISRALRGILGPHE
jgi:hypothetical protein